MKFLLIGQLAWAEYFTGIKERMGKAMLFTYPSVKQMKLKKKGMNKSHQPFNIKSRIRVFILST